MEEDESGWVDEEEMEWGPLESFDMFKQLKLSRPDPPTSLLPPDRIRSAFHRLAPKCPPEDVDRFRKLCLAFTVLKEPELQRIYLELGYEALRQSESYSELSVFDYDPDLVYQSFFDGADPADREYLLMNGAAAHSDQEGDEDDTEDEEGIDIAGLDDAQRGAAQVSAMEEDDGAPPPAVPHNVSALLSARKSHDRPEPDPWAQVSAKISPSLKRSRADR